MWRQQVTGRWPLAHAHVNILTYVRVFSRSAIRQELEHSPRRIKRAQSQETTNTSTPARDCVAPSGGYVCSQLYILQSKRYIIQRMLDPS